jgi:hypothetical protein
MIFLGEETRGLSNAIVRARLDPRESLNGRSTVLHVGYEGQKLAAHSSQRRRQTGPKLLVWVKAEWMDLSGSGAGWSWSWHSMSRSVAEGASWEAAAAAAAAACR